ncbi:hypothetical protein ACP4OV_027374 [Aristida adscensionis]
MASDDDEKIKVEVSLKNVLLKLKLINQEIEILQDETNNALRQWMKSTSHLDTLISNLTDETALNLTGFLAEVETIKYDAVVNSKKYCDHLKDLDEKLGGFRNDLLNKVWLAEAKIPEKDVVALILDAMHMDKAEYFHTIEDDGYYIGYMVVDVNSLEGFKGCGKTKLKGKASLYVESAENGAAIAFIKFWHEKVTYDKLLKHPSKLAVVQGFGEMIHDIANTTLVDWGSMMYEYHKAVSYQLEPFNLGSACPQSLISANRLGICREELVELDNYVTKSYDTGYGDVKAARKLI